MIKISVKSGCENAPKKEFLKTINIAFAKGNSDFLIDCVTDNMTWNIIGDKKIEGKDEFAKVLETMKAKKVSELILDSVLTHGKEGAVSGAIIMQNGEHYGFSDFYEFSGAKASKIKSITSYVIKI